MPPEQQKLFDDHVEMALKIAGKRCGGDAEQPAIQQEARLGLKTAVEKYDSAQGLFKPFARRVITNHLNDFYRKNQRWKKEVTMLDADTSAATDENWEAPKDQISDIHPIPSHELERQEIRQTMRLGIEQLTPEQKRIVEAFLAGYTQAEIARQNGKTEQAVGQMFRRASENLRSFLKSRGIATVHFMPDGGSDSRRSMENLPRWPSVTSKMKFPWWVAWLIAVLVFLLSLAFLLVR